MKKYDCVKCGRVIAVFEHKSDANNFIKWNDWPDSEFFVVDKAEYTGSGLFVRPERN